MTTFQNRGSLSLIFPCDHVEAQAPDSWNDAIKNIYIGMQLFAS